jgi:hypothetical protein
MGEAVLNDDRQGDEGTSSGRVQIHTPDDIADRLGGISLKSLNELIRKCGVETTTLGYAEPSRKGGPRRRQWGMTETQLKVLLDRRRRRGGNDPGT